MRDEDSVLAKDCVVMTDFGALTESDAFFRCMTDMIRGQMNEAVHAHPHEQTYARVTWELVKFKKQEAA